MPFELTAREIALARGEDPDKGTSTTTIDPNAEAKVVPPTTVTPDGPDTTANTTVETTAVPPEPEAPPVVPPDDATPPGDPQPETDWRKENLELAKSYGLTEKQLEGFASEDEFDRFASHSDSMWSNLAKSTQPQQPQPLTVQSAINQPPAPQQPAVPQPQQPQQEQQTSELEVPKLIKEEELLDLSKYESEEFDAESKDMAAKMRSMQDSLMKAQDVLEKVVPAYNDLSKAATTQQQLHQQQMIEAKIKAADESMDSISEELFGRAYNENGEFVNNITAEQQAKREQVLNHQLLIEQAMASANQQIPTDRVMSIRASRAIFGEELAASKAASRVQEAKDQSKKIRPQGNATSTRPHGGSVNSEVDPHSASAIAANQAVTNFWNQAQQENGVV